MPKYPKIVCGAFLLLTLVSCEQKITQQVVLDTALLEKLSGKSQSSSNPSNKPTVTPSPRISPSQTSESPLPSEQSFGSPLQVIRDNAQALNDRNLNGYINTFHPSASVFSVDQLTLLFTTLKDFQTTYEIYDLQIQDQTQTQVSVLVDIDITDFGGTIEKSFLYTLAKFESSWKITSIEFLDPNELSDDF